MVDNELPREDYSGVPTPPCSSFLTAGEQASAGHKKNMPPKRDDLIFGVTNCLISYYRTFNEYINAWLTGVDLMNDVFPGYDEEL